MQPNSGKRRGGDITPHKLTKLCVASFPAVTASPAPTLRIPLSPRSPKVTLLVKCEVSATQVASLGAGTY